MRNLFYTLMIMALLGQQAGILLAADRFQTTRNGAQYRDLTVGSGAVAETGDVATIHFVVSLDDNGRQGKQILDTRTQGNPVAFVIGTDRVMPGWNEGVIGMRQGGRRLLRLPPSLAYGSRGVEDVIPPDASLIFIIELLDLEKDKEK